MAVLGELLFHRTDRVGLDDVLRHEVSLLQGKVDAIPEKVFSAKPDDEIVALIVKDAMIEPLAVDLQAARANVQETEVEVHDRFGFDRGPVRVPGLQATKSIPFTGDPALWRLRPNSFDLNPPRGEVRGNNLVIGMTVPASQPDEAARYIDERIAKIPIHIQRQEAQLTQHNASLNGHVMQCVKTRRQRLGSAADLLKKLGG